MSRNGSGTYSLPAGNPVTSGASISSAVHNNTMSDIATALTTSLANDGQTVPTANLPMGGFKHTNAADGSNLSDYATVKQVQNSFCQLTAVAGSNIITGTATPTPSAYVAGQRFSFVAAMANVGAATLNVSGLGAKSITKNGTTALVGNDILAGALIEVEYDGTQFQIINQSLINLASPIITGTPTAPTAAADTSTTQLATAAFVINQASATTPIIEGTAAVGTSKRYARADHVHPAAAVGVGQTWQDVSASRAGSTTYTNSTGRPITLNIVWVMGTSGATILVTVSGSVVARSSAVGAGEVAAVGGVIIPNGATYSFAPSVGTVSGLTVFELR